MARDEALLFQSALKSPSIGKARLLRKLLQYLFENRGDVVSTVDIWDEVLEGDGQCNGERVRELVSRLRKALEEIAWITDSLNYFEIPDADDADESGRFGYRLAFPERKQRRSTETFWRSHTMSDLVRLIYAEPVFFYDITGEAYLRFIDTNPRSTNQEAAIADLQAKHHAEMKTMFPKGISGRLKPTHDFVGAGEVAALDRLSEWFLRRSLLRTKRDASHRLAGLGGGCPILLGSMRTNRFIENILQTEEGKALGFHLDPARTGYVNILDASDQERSGLKKYTVTEREGVLTAGLPATLSPVRERLAIVQRVKMPASTGVITMISSDTSLAIQQVATALTDDTQVAVFLEAAKWKDAEMPSSFEMLFSIRIAPAGFEHEAGIPELISARIVG